MMADKELDDLVRKNYQEANTKYLLEQTRKAVTPHAYWTVENTVMAKFVKCSNCGIHIRVAREGKENERYYLLYRDKGYLVSGCCNQNKETVNYACVTYTISWDTKENIL